MYRFEKNYTRANLGALNEGMASGFRQLSIYSSANSAAAVDFLAALGYSQTNENLTRYAAPSLLSDSLFGVKYVSLSGVDRRSQSSQYLGMTRVLDATGVGAEAVYRNPNALPLAYGVPASVAGSAMTKSANPFENQNAFASALVGHAVSPFKQVEAKATDNPDGTRTWTIQVPEGSVGYVYVSTQATVDFGLSIDGDAAITENNRFEHALHPLVGESSGVTGATAAGYASGVHTVTLSSPTGAPVTGDQPAATCLFAVLDMNEVQSITRQLAQHPLVIEQFEDGHIRGTFEAGPNDDADTGVGVDADSADSDSGSSSGASSDSDSGSSVGAESGVAAQSLLITTPYSKGWQVTVNGVKVAAPPAFGGAATVIPVQPGRNTIDMRFVAPGLVPGAVVSAVTALGCVGAATIVAVRRKHGRRRL